MDFFIASIIILIVVAVVALACLVIWFLAKLFSPVDDYSTKKSSGISCVVCGNDSNGKHFCYDCYNKHKDHTILLKVENCRKFSIEEKYYDGVRILADDGHTVRSDGERAIDNFFYHKMIPHSYERPIYLNKDKYGVDHITPDFYLPQSNTYVEFLGYSGEQYVRENEFKRKIYTNLGITVIYLYRDDKDVLDAKLDYYLRNVVHGQLNHIRLDSYGKMVI